MASGGGLMVALIAAGLLADTKQGKAFIKETGAHAAAKALPGKAGKVVRRVVSAGAARGAVKARTGGQRTQKVARAAGEKTTAKAAARWDKRQAAGRPVSLVSRVRPQPAATVLPEPHLSAMPTADAPPRPPDDSTSSATPAGGRVTAPADDLISGTRPLGVPVSSVPVSSMAASGGHPLDKEHDMPDMHFDFTDAPESDADHLDRLQGLARGLNQISEGIAQYEETLAGVGLDAKSFSGLGEAAEAAAEAASALSSAARRFANVYQGVIETVANGTKLPDGKFFTGEAA